MATAITPRRPNPAAAFGVETLIGLAGGGVAIGVLALFEEIGWRGFAQLSRGRESRILTSSALPTHDTCHHFARTVLNSGATYASSKTSQPQPGIQDSTGTPCTQRHATARCQLLHVSVGAAQQGQVLSMMC